MKEEGLLLLVVVAMGSLGIAPSALKARHNYYEAKEKGLGLGLHLGKRKGSTRIPTASQDSNNNSCGGENVLILACEKVGNGITRRYVVDDDHKVQIIESFQREASSKFPTNADAVRLDKEKTVLFAKGLPRIVRDFFLPTNFPESVSKDYLQYMLWQFPTNITGWTCSTLVTSSLFKAVGVGTFAGTTVAATAAIKWVSRDGLGAVGRLLIGGNFATFFDDDPKQWRMYADFIGSAGSIFELATPLAPEFFLPLASLGNLTKAVARGLKDPSSKVIQNHFAISGNVGEIAAKEEVWSVVAELIGLSLGILLLVTPGLVTSYPKFFLTWVSIRSLHLWFRYKTLECLQLTTINYKRAFLLVESHISGFPVPGLVECNKREDIVVPWQYVWPNVKFGQSFQDTVDVQMMAPETFSLLLNLYANEKHIIYTNQSKSNGVDVYIMFKEGATNRTILRSIWQAQWLLIMGRSKMSVGLKEEINATLLGQIAILTRSIEELNDKFDIFVSELLNAGWSMDKVTLQLPRNTPYFVDDSVI